MAPKKAPPHWGKNKRAPSRKRDLSSVWVGLVPSLFLRFAIGGFMLRKFYLASVLVFPCQFGRVHCCPYFSTVMALALPHPSLFHIVNFYTVKRYFRSKTKAKKWAAHVVRTHTIGLLKNPILTGGQLSLF
jgi:hypothetical protein